MANTPLTPLATTTGVRSCTVDTNATDLLLGTAGEKSSAMFAVHLVSNSASGTGVTVKKRMRGNNLTAISSSYYGTDGVASTTAIAASALLYIRCEACEEAYLSFAISGGSWSVYVSQGPG